MMISKKFKKLSVIHEGIYYFPEYFEYTDTGVHAKVVYRIHKWHYNTMKITLELAEQIKAYVEKKNATI